MKWKLANWCASVPVGVVIVAVFPQQMAVAIGFGGEP